MIRISKQSERRATSPRRPSRPAQKSGPKKDVLEKGFKPHKNAAPESVKHLIFFPEVK